MKARMLFSSLICIPFFLFPINEAKADKANLLDRFVATFPSTDLDKLIVETAGPAAYADPNLHLLGEEEIRKKLIAKVDKDKLRRELRNLFDKNFSESDLQYLVSVRESPVGKKYDEAMKKNNEALDAQLSGTLSEQYNKVAETKYADLIKTIPQEAGAFTKFLWKWFPDSNPCLY